MRALWRNLWHSTEAIIYENLQYIFWCKNNNRNKYLMNTLFTKTFSQTYSIWKIIIKALTALVGRLILNGDLRLFHLTFNFLLFKQTVQTLIRRRVLRRPIWVCFVCQCPSPGFKDNPLNSAIWRYTDKNSAAINNGNRYLDSSKARFGYIGQW